MAALIGVIAKDTGRAASTAPNPVVTTTILSVPANSSIILSIVSYSVVPTSVVDSAGNTYSLDLVIPDGYGSNTRIYSKHNCAALVSGGTITVTHASAPIYYALIATAWSGVYPTSPKDVTATGLGTTAVSTAVSAATAEANELVISVGIVASNTALWSAGTGYTALDTAVGGSVFSIFQQYKLAGAAGTQQATATAPPPYTSSGLGLVTYKSGFIGPTASLSIISTSNITFTPSLNVPPVQPVPVRSSLIDSSTVISTLQNPVR